MRYFLVYVDVINLLGRNIHAIKENAKATFTASKEVRLRINAEKI
jgi:hypothetical protein